MCFNAPVCGVLAVAVGVFLAMGVFFPPPPLSARLHDWRRQGTYYNYRGHNIFYIDMKGTGSGGGTVVCLHGFPTFSWDWSRILPGLQTQFERVIMLDFLGFGFSDKPSSHSYSIFEQADIVSELTRDLSVGDVHLLSHDYGDTVALELLSRHNQAAEAGGIGVDVNGVLGVRSLTMLNGGVFPETNHPRPLQQLLLVPYLGPILSRFTFFSLFKVGFGEIFGYEKPTEEDFTDFYSAIMHNSGHHVTASLLQYIPERHSNKERWVGALRNSRVPVMMIYGPGDPVNPPEFAQMFRREAGQHRLVVLEERVGHYPQWEDPESTVRHLRQFQQNLPPQADTATD